MYHIISIFKEWSMQLILKLRTVQGSTEPVPFSLLWEMPVPLCSGLLVLLSLSLFIDTSAIPPDNVPRKGEPRKQGVSAAVLLGVISTNQFESLSHKSYARSQKREKMSDQVVSRVVPVMNWIKKHIKKDHFCIPRT